MTLPFTPTFLLYSALGILMLAGILLLAMLVTDWRDRLISNRLIISYAILFPLFLIVGAGATDYLAALLGVRLLCFSLPSSASLAIGWER